MKSNLIGISRASIEAEEAKHKGKASPPATEPVFTPEYLQAVTEHASEGSLHIPDRSTIIGASVTPPKPAVTAAEIPTEDPPDDDEGDGPFFDDAVDNGVLLAIETATLAGSSACEGGFYGVGRHRLLYPHRKGAR